MTAARNDAVTLRLPAQLNSSAAKGVLEGIKSHQGYAISVDASDVTMIGAQCLQVLIAAHQAWQTQGEDFDVKNISDDICNSLGVLGLTPGQIGARETAYGA